MEGEILPEINFVCQKETGAAGWRHYRQHSISVVFILDGKAGIPGGAAEGIRASDPHLPTPPATLQRKLFLSSCSF